jgi:malate dehydrogenase (oxaloacetate-decarboxylating)(NADP+)
MRMFDPDNEFPPGRHMPRGSALLNDPLLNKGTAFSAAERAAFGLKGLLPPQVFTIEAQVGRVLENYAQKTSDLERYIQLIGLQDRNETLFYRVVVDHIEAMLPIIYTPTVGLACQRFGHVFRRARGMYITIADRGHIAELLENSARQDVRAIVMTDGERTLGLGDQGACGMGIPIGKLALYTACGGIDPAKCLPIMLDAGTENEAHLADPLYIGLKQRRVRGQEYDDFVAEFVYAAQARWPKALLQFEDFGNASAFRLLARWRDEIRTFNDDIQGTAAVTLAGLLSALRISAGELREQTILFLGAGEAGVGIADLIVAALVDAGLPLAEARRRCWLVDSHGLVVAGRTQLAAHKLAYAHASASAPDFASAIRLLKPSVIVGVSAVHGAFNREVLELMCAHNARPIVFALSNPTSQSECTAEQAYTWSRGRAIFASGSPFAPCSYEGQTHVPGQCNNVYIFPGVALGVIASAARHVTDRMFLAAAKALAAQVSASDLALGRVFPALKQIREISLHIAAATADVAFRDGLASGEPPADLLALARANMWEPRYRSYVAG